MDARKRRDRKSYVVNTPITTLTPDSSNPRKADDARLALLSLSIKKLGFIMPMYATPEGMLLSGHQRFAVSSKLGITHVPVVTISIAEKDIKNINILFNRATNDFSAFDTGGSAGEKLKIAEVIEAAEELADCENEEWFANDCKDEPISALGTDDSHRYDKKATGLAATLIGLGVKIPVIVSASGHVVNGIHRLFAAKEKGLETWPVIRIPDQIAQVAMNFVNYLSMDFHVDAEFADLLRFSAYRRPQNNRGAVPKAYRFWGNGCRTLLDKDSYSTEYWVNFRDIHGIDIIDFGAGLGKVAPYLSTKGMRCIDFEPYRIDPDKDSGKPDPFYSKQQAKRFLDEVADGRQFSSIFLASVLNSVPFPKDRMVVLAIVHALSTKETAIYGTCRDISDFNYEYGGVRNANYFVFDAEPAVRIGDVVNGQPKIQKFHTREEAEAMFSRLWNKRDYWPGGNVFYFKLSAPKGINLKVLKEALHCEFDLPYAPCPSHPDGSRMGLGEYAVAAFSRRLKVKL